MEYVDTVLWPAVKPSRRLALWKQLLGVDSTSHDLMNQRIAATKQDLPNQRVIRVDAERTRAGHPLFKTDEMRARIRRVMTYYVKNRSVVYKQGLNELLPPFVLAAAAGLADRAGWEGGAEDVESAGTGTVDAEAVERVAPDAVVYQMLERTVAKFLPTMYAEDDDFVSLQCSFRLFRLTLQYHCPWMCTLLDTHDIPPELYATPWIITMFARMLEPAPLLVLWDFLLWHGSGRDASGHRTRPPCVPPPEVVTWTDGGGAEAQVQAPLGPEILHFVAVAFLMSHADAIEKWAQGAGGDAYSNLLGGISRLQFRDAQHIREVCLLAGQLYLASPVSLRDLLFVVCYAPGRPVSGPLLARLEERVCAKVSVGELLASQPGMGDAAPPAAAAGVTVPVAPKYFVVDCRPAGEWAAGHLPTALHLDPRALLDPSALDPLTAMLGALQGQHLAVMGEGDTSKAYYTGSAPAPPLDPTALLVPGDISDLQDGRQERGAASEGGGSGARRLGMLHLPKSWRRRRKAEDAGGGGAGAHASALVSGQEGDDYSAEDVTRLVVLFLLQRGFKYVSEVQGGYAALRQRQGDAATADLLVESELPVEEAAEETAGEAGGGPTSTSLAQRLVSSLFTRPEVVTPTPSSDAAAFAAASGGGEHACSTTSQAPTSTPRSRGGTEGSLPGDTSPDTRAFDGASAAATTTGGSPASAPTHPALREASAPVPPNPNTAHTPSALSALHRSRQLGGGVPSPSRPRSASSSGPVRGASTGTRGRASTSHELLSSTEQGRPRRGSFAGAQGGGSASTPSTSSAQGGRAPSPDLSVHVPDDAFFEAQCDSLAGEGASVSPFLLAYADLYTWLSPEAASPPPATPPPPPAEDKPTKRGLFSRLRQWSTKRGTGGTPPPVRGRASDTSPLSTLQGRLPRGDLTELLHARVLQQLATPKVGCLPLQQLGATWTAGGASHLDPHAAPERGDDMDAAHSLPLGCGAFLCLSLKDASRPVFGATLVASDEVYTALQRAGGHEGRHLMSPSLLPYRRFLVLTKSHLLVLRPRLCPLHCADALHDTHAPTTDPPGMSGSLTGRVAVDVDGDSPAGTTSPQAPFMLAVDLQRMDAEARWSLSSLKRLTLKHTIPGMVVVHSVGYDGAPRRLAFVVDRLSALVHSVQEAIKRRRR